MYPNIEAERARLGMSRQELAGRLGVTRKTLHNWMTVGSIPAPALIRMCELFSCTADYLLSQDPPPT